jgi:phospholipase/carboxylesterase
MGMMYLKTMFKFFNENDMYIKEPSEKAQAVVIWLHGLGSNPDDMAGLSQALSIATPIRHLHLAAPMRPVTINQGYVMPAWYDIMGDNLTDRQDLTGITASTQTVHEVIEAQLSQGMLPHQIYVAGFSQGAAISLFAGLSCLHNIGGIVALSGYLPCIEHLNICQSKKLPIFMGVGRQDEIVLPAWTAESESYLLGQGFNAIYKIDYNMGHSVCAKEIMDLSLWLAQQISSAEVL